MVFFSYKEREKKEEGKKAIIDDNPTTVNYLAPLQMKRQTVEHPRR